MANGTATMIKRNLPFQSAGAIALFLAGLYTYLVQPNFMDQTWGVSFALAIVLLIQSITRELETRYTMGALFSVVFLGWNFIACHITASSSGSPSQPF